MDFKNGQDSFKIDIKELMLHYGHIHPFKFLSSINMSLLIFSLVHNINQEGLVDFNFSQNLYNQILQ